jgi:uncharacterized protein YkwD
MVRPNMRSPRLSILLLTAALAASLLIAPAASAAGPSDGPGDTPAFSVADAEQYVMALINERRDTKHLRPLQLDPRVAKVARARSRDMIDRAYFDHKDPDGKYARQHLERANIRFSRVSEIIAWDRGTDLHAAAEQVVGMWMDSKVHRHEILSTTHNYFGAGLATDGRTIKWTVISITGPDRTDPTARITSATRSGGQVTVRWTGSDPLLVVGTAGLRDFDLMRRAPGGAWSTARNDTTQRSATLGAHAGTEFRVRARDRSGYVGAWSAVVTAD